MKSILKKVGGFILVVGVFILAKFKAAAIFGVKVLIVSLINLAMHRDSAAVAANRPQTAKPARQVAQAPTQKTNPAAKLAGPVAPVQSSPAITPSAPLGAGAIQAARNAAAAQNTQLSKETGQDVPAPKGAKPAAQSPAPQQAAAPAPNAPVVQQGAPTATAAPAAGTRAPNPADATPMRESFDYTRDTRRDPFVSLMTTSDLRPTMSDLRLTGILYDLSGRRPVAILRDIAGGQWRVTTGMTLGRMRVAQIKPKTIIFTIEEFGFNRQDSLILGDTTRVRHR